MPNFDSAECVPSPAVLVPQNPSRHLDTRGQRNVGWIVRLDFSGLTKDFRPKPRLFALLIGINDYGHVRPLRGAVPDILSVRTYLEGYLKVPRDQIQILTDQSASRCAIIDAFKGLQDDERIKEGDPILIYFAGHGSEIPDPEDKFEKKMQAIVPQDYCERPGNEILAIPDRTIGALIAKIANKKGDNIVRHFPLTQFDA